MQWVQLGRHFIGQSQAGSHHFRVCAVRLSPEGHYTKQLRQVLVGLKSVGSRQGSVIAHCGITVFHVMNACFVMYFAFENNVKRYGQACPFPGSILDNHNPHGKNRLTIRHYEGNKIPLSHYLFFPVPFQTQTVLFRLPTLWTKLHIHTTMLNPTFKGICNVDYWNIISLIWWMK